MRMKRHSMGVPKESHMKRRGLEECPSVVDLTDPDNVRHMDRHATNVVNRIILQESVNLVMVPTWWMVTKVKKMRRMSCRLSYKRWGGS